MLKTPMGREELKYVIKSVLVLVFTNYAHCGKGLASEKLVNSLADYFENEFASRPITSHTEMSDFVAHGASIIINGTPPRIRFGFATFAVNLVIKRMVPSIDPQYLKYLDAPLNRDELAAVKAPVGQISKITDQSVYDSVMSRARNVAGEDKLYQWELGFWNGYYPKEKPKN